MLLGIPDMVLWGMAGGIFAEIVEGRNVVKNAKGALPHYLKSFLYWGYTIAVVLAGGALVYMYIYDGQQTLSAALAVNIGASAPLIITNITAKPAQIADSNTE